MLHATTERTSSGQHNSRWIVTALLILSFSFCITKADEPGRLDRLDVPFEVPEYEPKTKVQLRRELSPIQFNVTQQEGTEPAFRNVYWNNKKEGLYRCVVCRLPLFTSATKYESGTGWPSYFAPLDEAVVGTKTDYKMQYPRTEVHCARCRAHLGHVFNDGPAPTGKRYCMNSASLKFEATKLPEPNTDSPQ